MLRLLCISVLLLSGCRSAGTTWLVGRHALAKITPDRLAGGTNVPDHATFATWKADPKRLMVDIERAVKRSDWGLLEIHDAPTTGGPIRGEALLPDNRVARIYGWRVSDSEIAVAVAVGRFGDPSVQDAFLQMLAGTLADKPKPKRGGKFELP